MLFIMKQHAWGHSHAGRQNGSPNSPYIIDGMESRPNYAYRDTDACIRDKHEVKAFATPWNTSGLGIDSHAADAGG